MRFLPRLRDDVFLLCFAAVRQRVVMTRIYKLFSFRLERNDHYKPIANVFVGVPKD
jgi:hypothetical protein